jgi:hypothetical protein
MHVAAMTVTMSVTMALSMATWLVGCPRVRKNLSVLLC